jgi:cytochrome c-type biogenesis protein CcmH
LTLPFLLALFAFVTLLPIMAPLLRGNRPVASRANFDQAVYRDQLHELDRDIARGLITPTEAGTARLEIQRRLLATDKLLTAPSRLSRSPVLAVFVFVIVAAGSISSYLWFGSPELPDEPFSARKAEVAQNEGQSALQQATDTLAARLKQNPSDASAWLLYGRTLAMLSQWDQAEAAYRHAIDLGQTSQETVAGHAEIMVMQASGTVTPAAEAAFRQVLQADPNSGIARYYLALGAMQAGEPRKALDGFQALLAELPANSPLRGQLEQKVAEAARAAGIPVPELAKGTPRTRAATQAPGPDAAAVAEAATMTDEQRQTMVRGMVANLAAKQEADPANLDGWLRLGRAYAVLHESENAAEAYDKAAHLRPDDVSIKLQEVRALLGDHAPTDKLPPRVIDLLNQIEVTAPDQPLVLWYLGIAAAEGAHADEAQRYWGKLLAKVPAGGDDAKMIRSAIEALSKG